MIKTPAYADTPIFAELMAKDEHRNVPRFLSRKPWNLKDAKAQADKALADRKGSVRKVAKKAGSSA